MSHPYLPFLQRQLIIAFLGLLGGCGVEAKTWQGWWISEGLCRLLGRRLRPNSPGCPRLPRTASWPTPLSCLSVQMVGSYWPGT